MSTNLTAFTNGVADFARDYILRPLTEYLTGRGIPVSLEELSGVLNLPSRPVGNPAVGGNVAGMPPAMLAATYPNHTGNGNNPPYLPHFASGARPGVNGQQLCVYEYRRGAPQGTICNKPCPPGSNLCKAHSKTSKGKAAAVPNGIPGMQGYFPAVALPPGYNPPTMPGMPSAEGPAQPGDLSVVNFDESKGLYREPIHNLIVTRLPDGEHIAVVGYFNPTEGKLIYHLTEQQKATASSLGLVVLPPGSVGTIPGAAPSGGQPTNGGAAAASAAPSFSHGVAPGIPPPAHSFPMNKAPFGAPPLANNLPPSIFGGPLGPSLPHTAPTGTPGGPPPTFTHPPTGEQAPPAPPSLLPVPANSFTNWPNVPTAAKLPAFTAAAQAPTPVTPVPFAAPPLPVAPAEGQTIKPPAEIVSESS
jgi:hypothetical protein